MSVYSASILHAAVPEEVINCSDAEKAPILRATFTVVDSNRSANKVKLYDISYTWT